MVSRHDELRTGGGPPDDAPLVRYQLHGKVAVLTINRPERHNAWTFEVEKELFDLADRADSDDRVGAVVLTGAGTSFCPGMDMKVLAGLGAGPGWPRGRGLRRICGQCGRSRWRRSTGGAPGSASCRRCAATSGSPPTRRESAARSPGVARRRVPGVLAAPPADRPRGRDGPAAFRADDRRGGSRAAAPRDANRAAREPARHGGRIRAGHRRSLRATGRSGGQGTARRRHHRAAAGTRLPKRGASRTSPAAWPDVAEGARAFLEKRPPAFAPLPARRRAR